MHVDEEEALIKVTEDTNREAKGRTYRVMLCHRFRVSRKWIIEVRAGGWSYFSRTLQWCHVQHLPSPISLFL